MSDLDSTFLEEMSWLNAGLDADHSSSLFEESWSGPSRTSPIDIPSPRSSIGSFPANESLDFRRATCYRSKGPVKLNCELPSLVPLSTSPSTSPTRLRVKAGRDPPTHLHPQPASSPPNSSTSSPISRPEPAHRSEWLYRRPKYARGRSGTSVASVSPPSPTTPMRSRSRAHERSHSEGQSQTSWSAELHPRSRADQSFPALETRPSGCRSPSLTSTASSNTTITTSSSRPVTPVSPGLKSGFKIHHPSKSILTRTSSNTTKTSIGSSNCNKSVKFVDMPTIHHPSAGYWDMDGIDITNMDGNPFETDGHTQVEMCLARELLCQTPTPGRERAKGLSRFLKRRSSKSLRPSISISGPFALGTMRNQSTSADPYLSPLPISVETASIRSASTVASSSRTSTRETPMSSGMLLRHAPSLESFKSDRSNAGRSVRSLGSVRSESSTNKFRSWLARVGLNFRTEMGCAVS